MFFLTGPHTFSGLCYGLFINLACEGMSQKMDLMPCNMAAILMLCWVLRPLEVYYWPHSSIFLDYNSTLSFVLCLIMQMVRTHPFWLRFPSCLQHMRHVLLQDVIFAKSEGTVRSYLYKCRQFLTWVKSQGLPTSLPFSVEVISVFLHQSK